MPKQTIKDILESFREEARNSRDLGDKFERLIAAFLIWGTSIRICP